MWYEEQVPGLGDQFAEEIYRSAGVISKNPEAYPKKRAKIREFLIDRFPFLVVYEYLATDRRINILHIFHTSRNPKLKYKRS